MTYFYLRNLKINSFSRQHRKNILYAIKRLNKKIIKVIALILNLNTYEVIKIFRIMIIYLFIIIKQIKSIHTYKINVFLCYIK